MVGDSVYKCLKKRGYLNVYRNKRKHLDLLDSSKLDKFLKKMSPSLVIFCAAKVGGIKARVLSGDDLSGIKLKLKNY